MFFVSFMSIFFISPIASAGDFDWIKDFNIGLTLTHRGLGQGLEPVLKLGTSKSTLC